MSSCNEKQVRCFCQNLCGGYCHHISPTERNISSGKGIWIISHLLAKSSVLKKMDAFAVATSGNDP
eukprot:5482475-Ditylum_brightwellii.AAC.1